MSRVTGKYVMFMVFGMMGILLFESVARTIFNRPHIWAVEFSQFVMAAYYTLGGAYSHLIEGNVRMDIFYHKWSPRRKAMMDCFTFSILAFYLVVLLRIYHVNLGKPPKRTIFLSDQRIYSSKLGSNYIISLIVIR